MELSDVTALIQHLNKLQVEADELKKQLKLKEAEIKRFSETVIPDMFKDEDLSELALANGKKVIIKSHWHCSITEAKRRDAIAWLRGNGRNEMIKSQAIANFSTSEVDAINRELLLRLCAENDLAVEMKDSVHPSTLKSWVRGMKETNTEFPDELFGVYERRETLVN